MIRVSQIKMPDSHSHEELPARAACLLHIKRNEILSWRIVRKSVDARKKPDIYFIYTVDLEVRDEERILCRNTETARRGKEQDKNVQNKGTQAHGKGGVQIQRAEDIVYRFPACQTVADTKFSADTKPMADTKSLPGIKRPVIVGTGPAGLFCGYLLAEHGFCPILLERGKAVENRQKDVENFWKNGILAPDSNVQFGEGGAGTFSDGKLNTLVKDKNGRNREVLKIFVRAGAPEEILYEAKPHIGTDMLVRIVRNLREEILSFGGEVWFESKMTDLVIEKGAVRGVIINDKELLETDSVVLAAGHSARDTFQMLYERKVPMEAKAFAVGLRVEHPRKMINKIQYGKEESRFLQAADYKVTAQAGGRGIYSFCMCPGGYVVNASSEKGHLAVNGMSYSGRNGQNSNSAVIVTVTPDDFENGHPLSGVAFQRMLEEKAYRMGQGAVPVERYGEFKEAVTGALKAPSALLREYPDFEPEIKGCWKYAPVHEILPEALNRAFVEGMEQFGKKLPGFSDSGVFLSGVESRTSSPVRIHRDETGQSAVRGLYPCGEGAGYAGGIMSAAMDGMLTAEKLAMQVLKYAID